MFALDNVPVDAPSFPPAAAASVNAALRDLHGRERAAGALDARVELVDFAGALAAGGMKPAPALFAADGVHLVDRGYDAWAAAFAAALAPALAAW